jgi:hypothetical protein
VLNRLDCVPLGLTVTSCSKWLLELQFLCHYSWQQEEARLEDQSGMHSCQSSFKGSLLWVLFTWADFILMSNLSHVAIRPSILFVFVLFCFILLNYFACSWPFNVCKYYKVYYRKEEGRMFIQWTICSIWQISKHACMECQT